MAPLTDLVGVGKKKLKWTEVHQKAFEDIKKVMAKETILTYPNFNEVFEIHTDASDRQLGTVISQNGKPLAFYSKKLSGAQRNYTTTEQELLSIRVMRWRLLLEEYGPEIEYIKGPKNVVADALHRLPKQGDIINLRSYLKEIQAKQAKDRDLR